MVKLLERRPLARGEGEGEVVDRVREVGVVGGVVVQQVAPRGAHILDLAAETVAFFQRILFSATGAFVVVEFGVRRPEVVESGGADFQAEVDVVEGDFELVGVEAADL